MTEDIIQYAPLPAEDQGQRLEFHNEFDVSHLLPTVSTLSLSAEQKAILFAPFLHQSADTDIEIRPDGLIYLPWMEYAQRLTKAFPGQWTMIPQGMPKVKDDVVVWGFWLVIQGVLVDFAIGGQRYYPNNPEMGYDDACEGAKSNALMRLCKRMGIGLELWKPAFIRDWKAAHAESYTAKVWVWDKRSGRKVEKVKELWRKKGVQAPPIELELGSGEGIKEQPTPPLGKERIAPPKPPPLLTPDMLPCAMCPDPSPTLVSAKIAESRQAFWGKVLCDAHTEQQRRARMVK